MLKKLFNLKSKRKLESLRGQYFFLHIPKTAGTTFRHLLYQSFDSSYIYPTQHQLKDNGGSYLSQKKIIEHIDLLPQNGIIAGHYNIRFAHQLSPSVKIITFLREPISRTQSHVKHIIRQNKKFHGQPPIIVLQQCKNALSNLQSRNLGYRPRIDNQQELLAQIEQLDFVGISEHFSSSIDQINQKFNWNLRYTPLKDKNVADPELTIDFSSEEMDIIHSYNEIDIKAYNFAVQHYERNTKLN